MKTPEEAFSGKRPDVGRFRIFGSSVYFHVTKDARKKLELTAELGILVGYTDTPHNYQVYLIQVAPETHIGKRGLRKAQKSKCLDYARNRTRV